MEPGYARKHAEELCLSRECLSENILKNDKYKRKENTAGRDGIPYRRDDGSFPDDAVRYGLPDRGRPSGPGNGPVLCHADAGGGNGL